MAKLLEKNRGPLRNLYGLALHYYTGTTGKRSATEFTSDDWYELLWKSFRMDELIRNHWQVMAEADPDHRAKLIVDEWGAWHDTADIAPGYLFGYFPTVRDALVSGITLDIFNKHCDKVVMANAAQLVNNIHTSFVAAGDKFALTPVFHVFEMYAAHQGGTAVRAEFSAPALKPQSAHGLWGLGGSCSMQGNRGVLTVVNPDIENEHDTTITARGTRLSQVQATVLSSTDIKAHNSFANPQAVKPVTRAVAGDGTTLTYKFAPASVTRLDFVLG
jgi:alpha-N-arabinofuranosidase